MKSIPQQRVEDFIDDTKKRAVACLDFMSPGEAQEYLKMSPSVFSNYRNGVKTMGLEKSLFVIEASKEYLGYDGS